MGVGGAGGGEEERINESGKKEMDKKGEEHKE